MHTSRLVVAALLALGVPGASAAGGAVQPFAVQPAPIARELILPGDLVQFRYAVNGSAGAATGTVYVANDLHPSYTALPMQRTVRGNAQYLKATVPSRLLRGTRLFYYSVVRDASGRSAIVPATAPARPQLAWILERPIVIRLGTHRFGHTRSPDAVVAHAPASAVGWQTEGDTFGPQTFLVGRDRSVWLDDGINNRVLVWNAGHPNVIARTVRLGAGSADNDVALGPANSVYTTGGVPNPPRLLLHRLGPDGTPLWHSTLADPFQSLGANTALRTGPDGTLYALAGRPGSLGGQEAWMPIATPSGRPEPTAAQRAGIGIGQPVEGGMRLLSVAMFRCGCGEATKGESPRELRFALIDRRGRLVRAWRVLSATSIAVGTTTPVVVGGDPVVQIDVTAGTPGRDFKLEYLVLRLGKNERTIGRFSLRRAVYGDNLLADLRIGPYAYLYQLASSPTAGVTISRFSLR